ncbi:MAG: cell wall-binding repeat-containing protein, partial [Candidatus Syntrophonatronum acetioxidans]
IERIAGDNRYHTAAEIGRRLSSREGEKARALVAYGNNFPDALAAASYAAREGYPILLTEKDSLPGETRRVLEELEIEGTVVAGGPAVISEKVFKELPRAVRVAGDNRYATAVELSQYFAPSSRERLAATGLDFADAVTGALLAARKDQGILLVGDKVPGEVERYVKDKKIQEVTLLGGPAVIRKDLESRLALMLD